MKKYLCPPILFSLLLCSTVWAQKSSPGSLLKRAVEKSPDKVRIETEDDKAKAKAAGYTLVDRIVSTVNGEVILDSDFRELQKLIRNEEFIDEALAAGMNTDTLKTDRTTQLEYLIRDRLMLSEAKKLNLEATEDRVDKEIEDMSKRAGITSAEIYHTVGTQGFTRAEYRSFLKAKIERQNLIESEIISRLRISDDDAFSEYLKTNPQAKTTIDEFSVAHIFFSPRKEGGAQAAYQRAQKALTKLRQGEKFETLAGEVSEDPNFSSGGYLGTFKAGEFLKEVEDAVISLNVDDYSQVVKSRMGFHIVKLLSKKETPDPQFLREKDRIKGKLMSLAFRRQVIIWFQNKRDEAYITINAK